MSQSVSLTKIIYDPSRLRTPNIKEIKPKSSSKKSKDATDKPFVMDEYGQTPDHFYLAKKPPASVFQVKRKLNLQPEIVDKVETRPKRSIRKKEVISRQKEKIVIEKPRYDTSLGQLTKKFLKLLYDAVDGIINLNTACAMLCVPKRRLYDITNVLEGAGLIQKTTRNNIKWMGRTSSSSSSDNGSKCDIEKEIDILEAKENKLDELIYHMKSEINAMKESESRYHYVTSDDLKGIEAFAENMLVAVKIAPSGQFIEAFEKKMTLTSQNDEIDSFLLSEENLSFSNILHHGVEFKENSFNVTITNSQVIKPEEEYIILENGIFDDEISIDPLLKRAYISEQDDFGPMGTNFLLQTDDQDFNDRIESLSLPLDDFDSDVTRYAFSLDEAEGLTDLFDCNFSYP